MTLAIDRSYPLLRLFRRAQQRLRRYRLATGCVFGCGITALFWALTSTLDNTVTLRESWAFWLVSAGVLAGCAVLLRGLFLALFRGPTYVDLALGVEQVHPELMDSLVCAVEIAQREPAGRRPLEKILLERVAASSVRPEMMDHVLLRSCRFGRLAFLAFLFAGALGIQFRSQAVRKAGYYLADFISGQSTGIVLANLRSPLAEHSDLRIEARINRWETEASVIYIDNQGRHRYLMNKAGNRQAHFTFYDLTESLRFRVVTPSLSTRWHTVGTFRPPEFIAVEMRLEPPAYTRRDAQVFTEFRGCSTVAGSLLSLRVETAPGVEAALLNGGERVLFTTEIPGKLSITLVLKEDFTFMVQLTSPEGWHAEGPEITVRVEPDLPPVATILAPQKDTQIRMKETLPLEDRASDDFGVSEASLMYSVSGGERKRVVLFEAKPEADPSLDEMVSFDWIPEKLGLKEGDVVAYALNVTDNRDPDPQQTTTDIQFIFIRPDLEQQEQDGAGQQQEKMDVSNLITESKRLIRFTWDLLHGPEGRRSARLRDLSGDLKDLRLEMQKKLNELRTLAGGLMAGPVPEFLQSAEAEIGEAVALVERELAAESLPSQERALADLVALENELMKNAAKSKEGQSGEDGEQGKDSKPKEQKEDARGSQSRQQTLEALKQAIDEIQKLSERQDRLNEDIRRENDSQDKATAEGLADKQGDIGSTGRGLKKKLDQFREAERAGRHLDSALREMSRGEDQLRQSHLPAGGQHGLRAQNMLQAATRALEDAYRKAAANEIAQLAQAAEGLADAQRQQAQKTREFESREPDKKGLEAARDTQKAIRDSAQGLQEAIGQASAQLQETYPEAAEALARSNADMSGKDLNGTMTRAGNALLYKRFDRARKEQTDAANVLQDVAGALRKASSLLPAMSREELQEAMQRIREKAEQTQKAMQQPEPKGMQQLEQVRQQAAGEMDTLASTLQDPRLQQIAEDMSMPLPGEGVGDSGRHLLGMFQAALNALEQHLLAAEMKRRMELSRDISEPPEKYRRLVEKYFKVLSREQ